MRKIRRATLIRLLILWLLSRLSIPLAVAEVPALHDSSQTLRVGITAPEENGIFWQREGSNLPILFSKAIFEEISHQEGWRFHYVSGSQAENLKRLQRGELDLILALPYSPEYQDEFDFNKETLVSNWGQLFSKHEKQIRSILDMDGSVVAVVDDDEYHRELKEFKKRFNIEIDFLVATNYDQVLQAVESGFADAGVVDRMYALAHADDYSANPTQVLFAPRELKFATTLGKHTELLNALDFYLAQFKRNRGSVYYQVSRKYLGADEGYGVPRWLKTGLLILGVILVGAILWVFLLRAEVRDRTEELSRASQELSDEIRERRSHEEQLRKFGVVIHQMLEGVVITDVDGKIQLINPAFEQLTGFTTFELIGQNYTTYVRCQESDQIIQDINSTMRNGSQWRGRFVNRHKTGSEYEVEVTISPIRVPGGEIVNYLGILRDVTHQSQLELQLRQSQKLEAIGTLAGGIAHDFNNTLFTMLGYIDIVLKELDNGEGQLAEMLTQALKAGERAKELIRQILTFSRASEAKIETLELQTIAKETMKLIRPTIPTTIEVDTDFRADGRYVRLDPTNVHQILMNLCNNAVYAMKGRTDGKLSIKLESATVVRPRTKQHHSLSKGNYLLLTISDNGTGIPERVRERIFEPFFTTKPSDIGTGMGLSVVHGIVNKAGGEITVDSRIGIGTTFRIYLPEVETVAEPVQKEEKIIKGDMQRVLVVDDDQDVASTLHEMLDFLGYQTESMIDSLEALEYIRTNAYEIDLLITDMTMPKLTGPELARQSLAIRPDLPIILITGYGQELKPEDAVKMGIREMVMKPLLVTEVSSMVQRALNGKLQQNQVSRSQEALVGEASRVRDFGFGNF